MKPTPIHIIAARVKRLPLHLRVAHLQALVSLEKPYSVRRNELQSLLDGAMFKQIRRENREDKRRAS